MSAFTKQKTQKKHNKLPKVLVLYGVNNKMVESGWLLKQGGDYLLGQWTKMGNVICCMPTGLHFEQS